MLVPHRTIILVRWLLTGGLLNLLQRGGDWAGPQPTQAPPLCTKCNSTPTNGQCTNHRCCIMVRCSAVLTCPQKVKRDTDIEALLCLHSPIHIDYNWLIESQRPRTDDGWQVRQVDNSDDSDNDEDDANTNADTLWKSHAARVGPSSVSVVQAENIKYRWFTTRISPLQ